MKASLVSFLIIFVVGANSFASPRSDDDRLRDDCAAKAPRKLEMSGRKEFIAQCVADAKAAAKLRDDCAAKAPADLEMSARQEFVSRCVEKAKARPAKTAR